MQHIVSSFPSFPECLGSAGASFRRNYSHSADLSSTRTAVRLATHTRRVFWVRDALSARCWNGANSEYPTELEAHFILTGHVTHTLMGAAPRLPCWMSCWRGRRHATPQCRPSEPRRLGEAKEKKLGLQLHGTADAKREANCAWQQV